MISYPISLDVSQEVIFLQVKCLVRSFSGCVMFLSCSSVSGCVCVCVSVFFFVSGMHMVGESQSNKTSPPIPLCKWKNVPYGRPSQSFSSQGPPKQHRPSCGSFGEDLCSFVLNHSPVRAYIQHVTSGNFKDVKLKCFSVL